MHTTAITSETPYTEPVQQAILPWLDMLRQLYPPSALLVVGAGNGRSPWVQYLMAANYDNVTLVEADETAAKHLNAVTRPYPTWRVEPKLVARNKGLATFYTASLPTESSLLEPETLRTLWPNLTTLRQQTCQATTLAELQNDTDIPANWLLIDCLPAISLLQGDTQHLAAFDVIALRVMLHSINSDRHTLPASVDELQSALQTLGFRCIAIDTSRNPAISHALLVRDTAALTQKQQQQLAQTQALAEAASQQHATERNKLSEQLQQTQAAAEKAHAAAAQATQQAQAAAEAQATATAAAAKQAEERAAQVQQLTQAKAAAEKLATERQEQLGQLQTQLKQAKEQAQAAAQEAEKAKSAAAAEAQATATAAAVKQAEERAAQVQQLTQAKAAADKLLANRMAQIQAHEQRLQQLQAHSAETDHLNGLLQAEVSKAEAQIGLLKELFLKEQIQ